MTSPASSYKKPPLRRAKYRSRRVLSVSAALAAVIGLILANPKNYEPAIDDSASAEEQPSHDIKNTPDSPSHDTGNPSDPSGSASSPSDPNDANPPSDSAPLATAVLERLAVKGRAPKTGYSRDQFYGDWPKIDGCSLRQIVLKREFGDSATLAADHCTVLAGSFAEPYTGQTLTFSEKSEITKGLQIDHVVALSDAWQKGAQNLSAEDRFQLATDPLNLLAVDSSANQQKSDGDAATWLPANKPFRCQYVARQVSVKYKYHLWVTEAEKDAIARVLAACPSEPAVGVEL